MSPPHEDHYSGDGEAKEDAVEQAYQQHTQYGQRTDDEYDERGDCREQQDNPGTLVAGLVGLMRREQQDADQAHQDECDDNGRIAEFHVASSPCGRCGRESSAAR
jgi:hypothetical protein